MSSKELPKIYDPKKVEDKIYEIWENSKFFNPDNLDLPANAPSYTIVLPPPNVTGTLHMGHAAMLVYEDILTRHKRMSGFRTLWLPGTDHAAIATQTKVEKILKEKGESRHSLGREKFLDEVNKFAQESHDTIKNQVKKMGSSCDWTREAFTLDEVRNKAVNSVFELMYQDKLIYRGERVINWCPRCHSTLADDEVEHKEQEAKLYTFRYWKDFPIAISTTRPETKLGDTAVAVNPKDERYKKFVGQEFEGKFCGIDLKIRIIADRNIEMDFGTGALGVTPAHSMIDWKMAKDNDLNITKVINEDGKIRDEFKDFSGLTALEARNLVVAKIKEENLLEKEEDIQNSLSICYRCDTPIEPLPSLQWFIDVNQKTKKLNNKSIKEICIEAVEKGVFNREKINIIPQRFEKSYYQWMENLEDWCISRQIWYGHRIPVWYKDNEISLKEKEGWLQDSDTLDTWFSSGMWTFSTLAKSKEEIQIKDGKLEINSDDFKKFHPTSVLETGYDILFFWVARMIIMTTYAINDIPFQDIYLHGLVLDEKGKKMSKSKGNVLDPLDMIEKFGTDAVRLSLFIGSTPGNDMRISEEKIENYRNFVNKLWNISRFIIAKIGNDVAEEKIQEKNLTFADKWIINKTKDLISEITNDLEKYNFSLAGEELQEFTKNDFADWYLEVAKFETNINEKNIILREILEILLKLWHPFIPFVTEEIWSKLDKNKLLLIEKWPTLESLKKIHPEYPLNYDDEATRFSKVQTIIATIRNLRAENKIEPTKKLKATIYLGKHYERLKDEGILIEKLRTGIEELTMAEKGEKPSEALYAIVDGVEIYLINEIDKVAEQKRITEELEDLKKYVAGLEQRLSNKEFIKKAPAQIVAQENEKLSQAKANIFEMEKYLEKLI